MQRRVATGLSLLTVALLAPSAAQASFPGQNGAFAAAGFPVTEQPGPLLVYQPDGSSLRTLVDDASARSPRWSADGRRIAFLAGGGVDYRRTEVFVVNADGTGLTQVTHNDLLDHSLSWAPDGRHLVVGRVDDDQPDLGHPIVVIDLRARRNRERVIGQGLDPKWSPTGSRIAFSAEGEIFTMDPRGRGVRQVTNEDFEATELLVGSYDWSPDGRSFAYTQEGGTTCETCLRRIVRIGADGRRRAVLAEGPGYDEPLWAPDGRSIALCFPDWESQAIPHPKQLSIRPDGTGLTQLNAVACADDWQPLRRRRG